MAAEPERRVPAGDDERGRLPQVGLRRKVAFGSALGPERQPRRRCVLSQNGWFRVIPQRHSVSRVSRVTDSPSGPRRSRSPTISSGPSAMGTITVGRGACPAARRRGGRTAAPPSGALDGGCDRVRRGRVDVDPRPPLDVEDPRQRLETAAGVDAPRRVPVDPDAVRLVDPPVTQPVPPRRRARAAARPGARSRRRRGRRQNRAGPWRAGSARCSARDVATVDVQLQPGDEGRVVTREVGDRGRDLMRLAEPSHRGVIAVIASQISSLSLVRESASG